jgi:hypothetical protein
MSWFSAAIRFRTIIDDRPTEDTRTVCVFRAPGWDAAHARAIKLGRASGVSYVNGDEKSVERRLVRVETLDLLGDELLDGREVYFEVVSRNLDAHVVDSPEDSRPTQSGA